jgi:glucosyl-3-phosphoglycerate phosphatase
MAERPSVEPPVVQRLVLVRHGVTDWNREGRWQGRLDPPLSESGRHEASLVAARIVDDPDLLPARILASTLSRATETAAAIGDALGIAVEPEPRLVEIGAGEWEGRTHAELEATDGERYHAWRTTPGYGPPGGEPLTDAAARVQALLAEVEASSTWPVLLVSHGGILRYLARELLDLDAERAEALDIDNASVSAAVRTDDGTWRLERWNDTLHLLGRERTHVDEGAEGRPLAL